MRNVLVGLVALLLVGCTTARTPEDSTPAPEDYVELEYVRCVEGVKQGCGANAVEICERPREYTLAVYKRNLPALEVAGCADALYEALLLAALPEYACTYYQEVPGHVAYKVCMLKFAAHCTKNRQDSDCVKFCELMPRYFDYFDLVPCD